MMTQKAKRVKQAARSMKHSFHSDWAGDTRPRVYYAHCIALYDTQQEGRDIDTLTGLGWVVVNPNQPKIECEVQRRKELGVNYMLIFRDLIKTCDIVAFRALPDGSIPSGVHKELGYATELALPVIELPSSISRRGLTREQTHEYIAEVGKR
jgi:hypothetical protein